ncbi:MAG: hypothetical protein ABI693_21765 [Bryobacteraceae bacterium]
MLGVPYIRRFVSPRIPDLDRVLFVESGSRYLLENLLLALRQRGVTPHVDIVTCFAGTPHNLPPAAAVYRVADYAGAAGRQTLYRQLLSNDYRAVGIICSGEPIMTKWKWAIVANLPVKVFVLNENGDYFWLDRANWRTASHFAAFRVGLSGAGTITTISRIAVLPFTFLYLVSFAIFVHVRRKVTT